eukprot:1145536-Pelagomonas_calceolata.AAC.7
MPSALPQALSSPAKVGSFHTCLNTRERYAAFCCAVRACLFYMQVAPSDRGSVPACTYRSHARSIELLLDLDVLLNALFARALHRTMYAEWELVSPLHAASDAVPQRVRVALLQTERKLHVASTKEDICSSRRERVMS